MTEQVTQDSERHRVIVLRADRRFVYAIVAVFISVFLMSALTLVGSVSYAEHEAHKFCGLLITLDSAYQGTPPATPTGEAVANEVHNLVRAYGCAPGKN
jgi:hypothetical protein